MAVNKNEEFGAVPEGSVIRSRMVQMWFVSALGKSGGQLLQIVSLAVLARLLVPADFGMVAMVMAAIGIAGIFSNMGLSAATIRAKTLNEAQASSLLILNVGFGLVTSLVLFMLAPLITHVYQEPRTVELAKILSWSFLLSSLGTQHLALLRRQLKFGLLAKINLAAIAIGQAVAITLAYQGWGYWSIAAGMLMSTAASAIMAWLFNPWRPSKPEWSGALRSMVGFGGYLVIFSLLGYAALNAHNIIIGARYGAEEVGFYSRAFAILTLLMGYITGPMDTVAPAALARMTDDSEGYNATYLQTLSMLLLLTAPLSFVCAIAAPDIIQLLLGEQWSRSAIILQILGLAAIPQTLCNSSGWLYQSHGDSRSMMLWGIGGWGTLIVLLIMGTSLGIQGVAFAYSIGMFILVYPCMLLALRKTNLHVSDVLVAILPIAAPALIAAGLVLWLYVSIDSWCVLCRLSATLVGYAIIYLLLLIFLFRQRALLSEIVQQFSSKLPKRETASS